LGTSVREIVDRLVFTALVTVDEYPFLELQKKFNSGEVFRNHHIVLSFESLGEDLR
jgi:hypothetical protein